MGIKLVGSAFLNLNNNTNKLSAQNNTNNVSAQNNTNKVSAQNNTNKVSAQNNNYMSQNGMSKNSQQIGAISQLIRMVNGQPHYMSHNVNNQINSSG